MNRKSIPLPPFTETGIILLVFCCIALIFVPEIRQILAEAGQGPPLPAITRMAFAISPGGIILIALVLGVGAGMSGLRSGSAWMRRLAVILAVLFGCMILVGLALPFLQR